MMVIIVPFEIRAVDQSLRCPHEGAFAIHRTPCDNLIGSICLKNIQERFNKLIYSINTIIKCGI